MKSEEENKLALEKAEAERRKAAEEEARKRLDTSNLLDNFFRDMQNGTLNNPVSTSMDTPAVSTAPQQDDTVTASDDTGSTDNTENNGEGTDDQT